MTVKKIRLNKVKFLRFVCVMLAALLLVTNLVFLRASTRDVQAQDEVIVAENKSEVTPLVPVSIGNAAIQANNITPAFLKSLNSTSLKIEGLEDIEITIHIAEDDIVALAKMIWGETRGVKGFTAASGRYVSNTEQIAACVWTVLNRVDMGYSDTIIGVLVAKNQFLGYDINNPVNPAFIDIARDCVIRWQLEKILAEQGISIDTGRVLPKPEGDDKWCWFNAASDGQHNVFKSKFKDGIKYDWSLSTPYEQDTEIDFNAVLN